MAPRPLICLTLNPSVDLYTTTEAVRAADKLRCETPQREPGGGGLNAARVLARLGMPVRSAYPSGGLAGQWLDAHLQGLGLAPSRVAIAGETRENLTVRARDTSAEYRFVMPGPVLSVAEQQACLDTVLHGLQAGDWVIASGSLPPDTPVDTWARLAQAVGAQGARLVLDTSGAGLRAALGAGGLELVKPNLRELREATGLALPQEADWVAAVRRWVSDGVARRVALSLGERGAMLASAAGVWRANALDVPLASSVGAGDSFCATLVWALRGGLPDDEALAWAVAGGTAALLRPGTGLAQRADIEALRVQARVTRLA